MPAKQTEAAPCPAEAALIARGYTEVPGGIGGGGATIFRRLNPKNNFAIDVLHHHNLGPNTDKTWSMETRFVALGFTQPRTGPSAEVTLFDLDAALIADELPALEAVILDARAKLMEKRLTK